MPDFIKLAWQKFVEQPGSRHALIACMLLLLLALVASVLTPTSQPAELTLQLADDIPATEMVAPPVLESTAVIDVAPVADVTLPATVTAPEPEPEPVPVPAVSQLVIIIDDIGYNADAGRRAVNLPGDVTYAVIPYTPHGKTLAELAHQAQKEVMLHAPMSNLSGMDLGPGGLTLLQSEEEFIQTLQQALSDIPHIKGVNNHTGSELTAAALPMQWVMQELKTRGLYFVDSVTTNASVAATTAEQYQVPSLRRHVFLDNVQSAEAIDFEYKRALALAQKQGFAVAIGHPYPETLAYLETALPLLTEQHIQLVSASALIEALQKPVVLNTTAAW